MSEQVPNKAGNEANSITVGLPDLSVRSQLNSLRRQHGWESRIGHRCTNLLELTERYSKETDPLVREQIAASIKRQNIHLKQLLRR